MTNETEDLQITTYDQDGLSVVAAQGDVDLLTQTTLRQALESACATPESVGTVAVDMRQVPFIDSAGLALLVEMRKRFLGKCQLALIIEKSSQPERVLKLGRFDTFLKVGYSLEEVTAGNGSNSTGSSEGVSSSASAPAAG